MVTIRKTKFDGTNKSGAVTITGEWNAITHGGSRGTKKSEDGTELDNTETISRSMNSDMREPFRNTATHGQLILLWFWCLSVLFCCSDVDAL